MTNRRPPLSKSRFLQGKQCELSLWYFWNRKDLKPEHGAKTVKFEIGNKIGALAKQYFGEGVEVTVPYKIEAAAAKTRSFIEEGRELIYEATAFNEKNRTSASVDILRKVPGTQDEWDLIEVKSAHSVKPYHLDDIAFQLQAFTGAGYKIRKAQLMLVNGPAWDSGSRDPQQLFRLEDVTAEAKKRGTKVKNLTQTFNRLAQQTEEPVVPVGPHCSKPFECPYKFHCWKNAPKV
jgi:hypothetical protein